MLRRIALPVSVLCLVGLSLFVTNCGSSKNNNSSAACTGGPYNVAGDWNLTLGVTAGAGAISTSGETLFFDSSGDVAAFPDISGACSFTGSGTIYYTPPSPVGTGTSTASVIGNVASATSITGTAVITSSSGSSSTGGFSAVPAVPLSTAPAALTGTGWEAEIGADPTANIFDLTFTATGTNADMTVSGTNTGDDCTVSGTITQETSSSTPINVFDTAITFTGSGCDFATINGLAFESSSDDFAFNADAAGTYLYAISSSSAAVLEVFVPAGGHAQTAARHHGVPSRF